MNRNIDLIKKDLKKTFELGKLEVVFSKLDDILIQDSKLFNQKILIKTRFSNLKNDSRKGIISYEEYSLRINQIQNDVLALIDTIKIENLVPEEKDKNFEQLLTILEKDITEWDSSTQSYSEIVNSLVDKADKLDDTMADYAEGKITFNSTDSEVDIIVVYFKKLHNRLRVISNQTKGIIDLRIFLSDKISLLIDELLASIDNPIQDKSINPISQSGVKFIEEVLIYLRQDYRVTLEANMDTSYSSDFINFLDTAEGEAKNDPDLDLLLVILTDIRGEVDRIDGMLKEALKRVIDFEKGLSSQLLSLEISKKIM